MSNLSKGNIDNKEYKLAMIRNQLEIQLNGKADIDKIMERLESVNINKLNHEATETIRRYSR
jgi:hypothetical protein